MTRRRRGRGLIITGVLLVALVGAFFVADTVLRGYAEDRAQAEIADRLPENVTGDVAVEIGGFSVIAQYLTGSFDAVRLVAPALTIDGATVAVDIRAADVPTDTSQPIGNVTGSIDLDEAALNTLLQSGGQSDSSGGPIQAGATELKLADNAVTYAGSVSLFGFEVGYQATAAPSTTAEALVLTPTSAELSSGAGSIDASNVLDLILGEQPVTICVAQYLPQGVTLTGVDATAARARITLESSTLTLTEQSLTTLGTCSPA
ncbi:DUF2993 domain-containing protein [Cryobacterium sp. 1639]|uniref:LmeA family phospholipid-binding protein n=1 Tax=Cryobacterium inferilacus TaxID=2866629 RepID=UPI001C72A529|nr:DUF2993 domain-containing protein [Cryobacterium sp. 1639]MBX0301679.1 DUF2993 domain-containing protein [Cryobacterium sp. 1639]